MRAECQVGVEAEITAELEFAFEVGVDVDVCNVHEGQAGAEECVLDAVGVGRACECQAVD